MKCAQESDGSALICVIFRATVFGRWDLTGVFIKLWLRLQLNWAVHLVVTHLWTVSRWPLKVVCEDGDRRTALCYKLKPAESSHMPR